MENAIAVIGAGVIGGAIVDGLVKSGYKGKIIATRRNLGKLKELKDLGVLVTNDNVQAAKEADIVFICVKPNDVLKVLEEIREAVTGKLVVSTAATIPLKHYKKVASNARFVRTMPNIAILVQESFTVFTCESDVTQEDKQKLISIFSTMGICWEVEEKHMDAVTALSGSGPGYISIIIEALMYAGLKVGLPRDLALHSAAQTVLGTGKLALEMRGHVSAIKDMVTTPGGTTIEAIYELEGSQIRQALMRAVEKATVKCQKIRENLALT